MRLYTGSALLQLRLRYHEAKCGNWNKKQVVALSFARETVNSLLFDEMYNKQEVCKDS